jgi:cytochrome c oxidase cbb3-type subunit 3
MKFKNYLESISGISIYPLLSLLLFFLFFTVLLIWVFRTSKERMQQMKNIPFVYDEEQPEV